MKKSNIALAIVLFGLVSAYAQKPIEVIPCAHSHNDYTRRHPLHDALANGFTSIEVDVFHINSEFYVAHTKAGIRKNKTLQNLYLKPLQEIITQNNGSVYFGSDIELILMIDLKGNWSKEDLIALSSRLDGYKDMFTIYSNGTKQQKAVRILLSGNGRKYDIVKNNPRLFSIDGRFNDFESSIDLSIIPRTSANYTSHFRWKGFGKIPEEEKILLKSLVAQAHENYREIRFWNTPDKIKVWEELLDAGVDWVNVDKLNKFSRYYAHRSKSNL